MQFHKLLQPPVGADLSCPPPIYRPSPGVPQSGLFCYCALSALAACSTIQMKKGNNII